MANIFDSLYQLSTRVAESGILMMDSTLRIMQSAVARLTSQDKSSTGLHPPINGPETMDDAISDFANRLARIAWMNGMHPAALAGAWREVVESARMSFNALDLKDPRRLLAFPFELPLSVGTLLTQQSLRGLYTNSVVGPRNIFDFATYMVDAFTEIEVIISLQYQEQLRRYKERVKENPEDAEAHLRLGRTYIKLGLYKQAVDALAAAVKDPSVKFEALRESAVANFRAGNSSDAVRDGAAALALKPSDDRTRFWLWLAAEKLGGYPPEVPAELRMEVKAGRHRSAIEFEDVASRIGLDKTSAGRGTAIFDMDGDGHLDVVIASAHGGCSVYRNNGDGTFKDVTIGSGLDECINTFAIAVGDYNNDGLDDLYITRLGFANGESVLYRNNGDGTFTDVTKEAGVGCWAPSFTAQWVDYDCDGFLDLFVASNLGGLFDRKAPNRLFHNNGHGTFTEVTEKAGLRSITPTIGSAWGDYNNDGYPDLFISSGLGRSQLYRNNGDGTFTEVSSEAGVDEICFASVAFWCDYDNDGWLDLVQFTWAPETDMLQTLMNGEAPAGASPMRIYHNNRDGSFTKKDRELGLDGCWGTMSGNGGDFNNDGYIDFLLGNGDPHMDRTEPAIILENDGKGKYHNVTFAAGLPFTGKGHGSNMADLAGDGRMCLIVASGGAYPGDLLTTNVFRPKSLPGNFLNIRFVGTKSNRNAVGARVKLDAGGRSQHKLVNGGSGFGYLPYEQHFGLGKVDRVDGLEILWPSGLKQNLENLPINTTIRVTEGRDGWEEVYRKKAEAPVQADSAPASPNPEDPGGRI
jgi:tetratricopeptide (TPR) repeat protein